MAKPASAAAPARVPGLIEQGGAIVDWRNPVVLFTFAVLTAGAIGLWLANRPASNDSSDSRLPLQVSSSFDDLIHSDDEAPSRQ